MVKTCMFASEGLLDESRDLTKSAERCILLAEHVHRQYSEDNAMRIRIRDSGNFCWTPQPEVAMCIIIISPAGGLIIPSSWRMDYFNIGT